MRFLHSFSYFSLKLGPFEYICPVIKESNEMSPKKDIVQNI